MKRKGKNMQCKDIDNKPIWKKQIAIAVHHFIFTCIPISF